MAENSSEQPVTGYGKIPFLLAQLEVAATEAGRCPMQATASDGTGLACELTGTLHGYHRDTERSYFVPVSDGQAVVYGWPEVAVTADKCGTRFATPDGDALMCVRDGAKRHVVHRDVYGLGFLRAPGGALILDGRKIWLTRVFGKNSTASGVA